MRKIGPLSKRHNATVMDWHGIHIIKISEINNEKFNKWMYGQTYPLVEEDENPTDWCYFSDYIRWLNGLPVID